MAQLLGGLHFAQCLFTSGPCVVEQLFGVLKKLLDIEDHFSCLKYLIKEIRISKYRHNSCLNNKFFKGRWSVGQSSSKAGFHKTISLMICTCTGASLQVIMIHSSFYQNDRFNRNQSITGKQKLVYPQSDSIMSKTALSSPFARTNEIGRNTRIGGLFTYHEACAPMAWEDFFKLNKTRIYYIQLQQKS